ncbi:tumor necrosis factor ligand superfamily member 9 [Orycteropus afer afer]|uniref:Tumor necrosis factor ligand superfamily member 9 n=1 Tax=Orycteropus afer afer TaxID=1230840 RepID=A0A8B7AXI8_ORYAF|nr:tumor necrosis factor ligand superfamily member 9 [Orycteropus afer afer]
MPAAPSSAPSSSSLTGACVQGPDHPQDAFAQLVASNVLLTNGTLRWHSERGLAEVSLAPGLTYDTLKRELVVAQGGVYYVFLHLELRRVVAGGGSGSVSVALHLQPDQTAALTLVLDLLAASSDSAGSSRGLLLRLGSGQRLAVHMRASAGAHPAWQLAQGATVLGLFRVAPEDPTGLSPPSPRPT